jgi:hypothetical protein
MFMFIRSLMGFILLALFSLLEMQLGSNVASFTSEGSQLEKCCIKVWMYGYEPGHLVS